MFFYVTSFDSRTVRGELAPTLGGCISELPTGRGVRGQKTPEMNVSRAVDIRSTHTFYSCLLYTSDAADE